MAIEIKEREKNPHPPAEASKAQKATDSSKKKAESNDVGGRGSAFLAEGEELDLGPRITRPQISLEEVTSKPSFLKLGGKVVKTSGGYWIEMKGRQVMIWGPKNYGANGIRQGPQTNNDTGDIHRISHIHGDPHVNEGGGGDDWHFGDDSTFILPDGTKICLDTKEIRSGVFVIDKVDIIGTDQRFHYGVGEKGSSMTDDGAEWDRANKDRSADKSAGVFALQSNGEWAIRAPNGLFYDVNRESWGKYLKDKDVDWDPSKAAVGLTWEQMYAATIDEKMSRSSKNDMKHPFLADGQELNIKDREPVIDIKIPAIRPKFLKHKGSALVTTSGGYFVEMQGTETLIWDHNGGMITRIWGDPHVDEKGGGDDWHFGDDSSFILPDGTKLCLDTKETSPGVFFTVAVDVLAKGKRFHYSAKGVGGSTGMYEDGAAWDAAHADRASAKHAGIFALQDTGEWAKQAENGLLYDVEQESWGDYLRTKDVNVDKDKAASGITWAQMWVMTRNQQQGPGPKPEKGPRDVPPQNKPKPNLGPRWV